VLCNQSPDRYLAVAAWSRGVCFFEKWEGRQALVILPFEGQARYKGIDDTAVLVGPAAGGDAICFCTHQRLYWYSIASGVLQSADFPPEFTPFPFRPRGEVANLAPGMVPLSVEASEPSCYSYVFGLIGERAHYIEACLAPSVAFRYPQALLPRAFVNVDSRNQLCVNASSEVWALTAEGTRRLSCESNLELSMPAALRDGRVIGFNQTPATPVVCGPGESETLAGDLDACNRDTVMGWIPHARGVCLVVRNPPELQVVWWEVANDFGKAKTVYAYQ
jgi:hypothetical protein